MATETRPVVLLDCPSPCLQYRLNYKVNTVPYTTIFAQASGFKVAWELPSTESKGRALERGAVQDAAADLYERLVY